MAFTPFKPFTEKLADGVWRHAGDLKHGMNIYFLEDEGGVTIFDAGTAPMADGVRAGGRGDRADQADRARPRSRRPPRRSRRPSASP